MIMISECEHARVHTHSLNSETVKNAPLVKVTTTNPFRFVFLPVFTPSIVTVLLRGKRSEKN